MVLLKLTKVCLASCLVIAAGAHRPVPEYKLDLDLPIVERYAMVLNDYNTSLHNLWDYFFNEDTEEGRLILEFFEALALARGPEPHEMQEELQQLAKAFGKPFFAVHGLQFLYELQTLMVPVENITLPWRGPGCTGIIATDANNGMVYHARNLDFSPGHIMQDLVYTAVFTRNGVEQYRYQTIAGYQQAITGIRPGPNGYTIERNTRYPDHEDGNEEMIKHLFEDKTDLNGWTLRKVFETCATYECAVDTLAHANYVSTEYTIISGVKKGTVLARNPTNVAHTLTLGQTDVDMPDPNYIIMTNFDFFFHDIREYFDPTGGKIDRPRRIVAQETLKSLKASGQAYTPDTLFDVIDTEGVRAYDTIFQTVMSVEDGNMYNASLTTLPAKGHGDAHVHHSSKKYIDMFWSAYDRVKKNKKN